MNIRNRDNTTISESAGMSMQTMGLLVYSIVTLWFIYARSSEIFQSMCSADSLAMVALNFTGTPFADRLFHNFSSKLIWAPLTISIVYVMLTGSANKKRAIVLILATVAIVAMSDQLSCLIKRVVERPRPSHSADVAAMLHYVNGYHGGKYGFVSSHAANCMGSAVWLMLLMRKRFTKVALISLSLIVGYSRIYLGVHYPIDVLGGFFVGTMIAVVMYKLFTKKIYKGNLSVSDKHSIIPIAAILTAAAIVVVSAAGIYL